MNNTGFREAVRYLLWCVVAGLVLIIVLANVAPFGVSAEYESGENAEISPLGPNDRVEKQEVNGETLQFLTDDLVYFSTEMPFKFDEAAVTITYSNPTDNQEVYVGFKDQSDWHYDTVLIDGLLNEASWQRVGEGPFLYQKDNTFTSLAEFLENPPLDKNIGIYNFDETELPEVTVPNYQPNKSTVIDVPLRGKVVFYAYIENEPFDMTVVKQDLNWYEGADSVPVKIYKENDVVYETAILDDGISDTSKKLGSEQKERIQNPGSELPEPGVYKVVIEAGGDTVIKQITTNFHKIVFAGPLLPVSNAEIYPGIVAETIPTNLFTDAKNITATTYHPEALQTITFPEGELTLTTVNEPVATSTANPLTSFSIPKSDVVVESTDGYFFFDPEHYFAPFPFSFTTLTNKEQLRDVDYVISNNMPPAILGDWKVATHTFDLTRAYISEKKLSWLIKAPGLKERGGKIGIKKIEVIFRKKPIIQL